MVLAEIRGVLAADAVFLDADAIIVEAADIRAAGARRESRGGDPGLGRQKVSQGRRGGALQRITGELRGGLEGIRLFLVALRGDDDLGQRLLRADVSGAHPQDAGRR